MKIMISVVILAIITGLLSGCTTAKTKQKEAKAAGYYTQLGAGYLQKNRLRLAKENLEKALQRDRNSSEAQHYYALLLDKLGKNKEAGAYFYRAVRGDSKNPELLNNFGSYLCRNGRYQEAVSAFLRATKDPLYQTPEFAYTNAGICMYKQGLRQQAEPYFRKALDLKPEFPLALYNMARLSYERNDYAKAQAFLYRYNERASSSPETLLLCYKTNQHLNEKTKAEECANTLLSRFPNSTEARELN